MKQQYFWELFLASGDPVAYLCYQNTRKELEGDVHQDPGAGAAGDGVPGF